VLAGALDVKAAADRLGVSPATVHEMAVAGDLAALRLGGVWRLPAWQFRAKRLLPGLSDLLASWPGSLLSLSVWACTPSPALQGRTPAQALTENDRHDAIRRALASSYDTSHERDAADMIHPAPRRATRQSTLVQCPAAVPVTADGSRCNRRPSPPSGPRRSPIRHHRRPQRRLAEPWRRSRRRRGCGASSEVDRLGDRRHREGRCRRRGAAGCLQLCS